METTTQINFESLPIKTVFVGKTKKHDDWDCFEWRVTINYKNGEFSIPYYCGLGHVTKSDRLGPKPKAPSNKDIMHSLLLDASAGDENFDDWCDNFGYSNDSISALNTYKDCLDIATRLRKAFTPDQLSAMREALQDY